MRLRGSVKKYIFSWPLNLAVLSGLLYVCLFIAFYPGFMSGDTINQFIQANGDAGFEDWHPALMSIVWRGLLITTGKVASLLALQLLFFCLALFLLSNYIYKKSGSRLLSLIAFAFGLSPHIVNLSGVLWKDSLLGITSLLFMVLILYINEIKKEMPKLFYPLVVSLFALLFIISNLRHNVWPALIPFVILLGIILSKKRRIQTLIICVTLVALPISGLLVNKIFSVGSRHVDAAVMVDDIQNLLSADEITASKLKPESKSYLINLQAKCQQDKVRTNSLFLCADSGDFVSLTLNDYRATKELWFQSVMSNPINYLEHRARAYISFLSPEDPYAWQEEVDPNRYGITALNSKLTKLLEHYVKFFIRDWPSIFKPYVWLLVGLALFIYTVIRHAIMQHAKYIYTFLTAGFLYTAAYIPAAIVSDYRMTYFLSLTVGISALLVLVDIKVPSRLSKTKSTK